MLSTLLTTKLYRPRPTASLVARPRLTRHLDEALQKGHPLILVVAPAGYGKTTLVSHWLSETPALLSTWLLLDEGDNDPVRFFTYVVAALQTLDSRLGQTLLDALPAAPAAPEELVAPLINDLASVNHPLLLVLDDYHLITHTLIHEAMAFLLDHAPPSLQLAVLTGVDAPFPLPRLRVRERMTEIRGGDLRFTFEEMTDFLNSVHRLTLSGEQIAALESRTEGWAAGVQLAALSLEGYSQEQSAQFIQAFSGSHHYVIDYLGDEVLRHQSEETLSFLLQTSILDRFTGALCDALLGGAHGSDRMLAELERKNLFLIPLDDERQWYRYHGEIHMLWNWLNTLPRELVRSEPELSHSYASCLTMAGYFEAAEEWLRVEEDACNAMPASRCRPAIRGTVIAFYRAVFARYRGDFAAAIATCQAELEQIPATETRYVAVGKLFLGQAHFYAGNTEAAEQVLTEAMQAGLASGHWSA
jgi:ATP/maltotriose-dependent transcriptional regulator MalT